MADNFQTGELFDDVAVAGKQNPDVGPSAQRAGKSRRDGNQAADADKIIHFGGDEQDSQKTTSVRRIDVTPAMQDRFQFLRTEMGNPSVPASR